MELKFGQKVLKKHFVQITEKSTIISILNQAIVENIDTIKTENLYTFDGKSGFSLGQGQ